MVLENRPYKTCQKVYFWKIKKPLVKLSNLDMSCLTFVTICNVVFSFDSDNHVFWDLQSFNHSSISFLSCMQKQMSIDPVTGFLCSFDRQHLRTDNILVLGAFKTAACLVLFNNTWSGSRQRHHTNCLLAYFTSLKLGMYFLFFPLIASSLDINCGSVSIMKCLLK